MNQRIRYQMWARNQARRKQHQDPKQAPFAPLLATALRAVASELDDMTFKLLVVLASYTNAYLVCFPGVQELARVTGYHHTQVTAGLECLESLGLMRYLRRAERDRITGLYVPNQYMVNPAMLYTRRELRPTVENLWGSPIQNLGSKSEHNHHNQYPEKHYQLSKTNNHHHQPQPQPLRGSSNEPEAPMRGQRDSAPKRAKNKDQSETPVTSGQTPQTNHQRAQARNGEGDPGAAGGVELYALPFPDTDAENLAHDLHTEAGNTQVWQCRELIDQHGYSAVCSALKRLKHERANGRVKNPMGLVKYWLRGGEDPEPAHGQRQSNRFTSGRFAEYIEQ